MDNLKLFRLKDSWKDWELTLEVDLGVLTQERATEINEFWGGAVDRLSAARGDVVRAVIKLAARNLAYHLIEQGGGMLRDSEVADNCTKQGLHDQEGWGGIEESNPFGWCGIRLVRADFKKKIKI